MKKDIQIDEATVVKKLLEEAQKVLENTKAKQEKSKGKKQISETEWKSRLIEEADKVFSGANGDPFPVIIQGLDLMPHIFVLGCVMDRQIKAERAWAIPIRICNDLNKWTIPELATLKKEDFNAYFEKNKLHRFNAMAAKCFHSAVQRIHTQYHDNAAEIWQGRLSSGLVVCRFLEFEGSGVKIATMATNILQRECGIVFSDLAAIDVSPDVQVRRILFRRGLISNEGDTTQTIYRAKAINPLFPGIIDLACWDWGRRFCHPNNPDCANCPLDSVCRKIK